MNDDTIGLTSRSRAAARAYESARSDALFTDSLASLYATQDSKESDTNTIQTKNEVGISNVEQTSKLRKTSCKGRIMNTLLGSRRLLNSTLAKFIGLHIMHTYQDIAVRTRFLDDIIQKNAPFVKQVVLLACGGDFRPHRLSFSDSMTDLTFFLLDVPHVLMYRQKCLAQLKEPTTTSCKVVEVACDLSNNEWSQMLLDAGFVSDQATLWLAEGFFHYLNEQQVATLFNQIQQLTLSSQTSIAFDLVSSRFQGFVRHTMPDGLIHFAVDHTDDVDRIFSALGCYDIECTSFEELGKTYDRNVSRDRSFIVQVKIHPVINKSDYAE